MMYPTSLFFLRRCLFGERSQTLVVCNGPNGSVRGLYILFFFLTKKCKTRSCCFFFTFFLSGMLKSNSIPAEQRKEPEGVLVLWTGILFSIAILILIMIVLFGALMVSPTYVPSPTGPPSSPEDSYDPYTFSWMNQGNGNFIQIAVGSGSFDSTKIMTGPVTLFLENFDVWGIDPSRSPADSFQHVHYTSAYDPTTKSFVLCMPSGPLGIKTIRDVVQDPNGLGTIGPATIIYIESQYNDNVESMTFLDDMFRWRFVEAEPNVIVLQNMNDRNTKPLKCLTIETIQRNDGESMTELQIATIQPYDSSKRTRQQIHSRFLWRAWELPNEFGLVGNSPAYTNQVFGIRMNDIDTNTLIGYNPTLKINTPYAWLFFRRKLWYPSLYSSFLNFSIDIHESESDPDVYRVNIDMGLSVYILFVTDETVVMNPNQQGVQTVLIDLSSGRFARLVHPPPNTLNENEIGLRFIRIDPATQSLPPLSSFSDGIRVRLEDVPPGSFS